jgi:hypothetical protein
MADLHTLGNNYLLFGSFSPPPLDHAHKSAQRRAALLKAQHYRDVLVDNSLIDPKPINILLNLSITTPSEIMGNCGNVKDIFGCTVDNVYSNDQPCLIASLTIAISPLVSPDGKKWLKNSAIPIHHSACGSLTNSTSYSCDSLLLVPALAILLALTPL